MECAKKVVEKAPDNGTKQRRQEQLDQWQKTIDQQSLQSLNLEKIVIDWWKDELKYTNEYNNSIDKHFISFFKRKILKHKLKKHFNEYDNQTVVNILSYRILNMFFQNAIHCPFRTKNQKQNKQDMADFFEENQKLFQKFLNLSIKTIFKRKKFQSIIEVVPLLKNHKKINILENLQSAIHKLYGKDWDTAKGFLIGAITGGVTSIFLGPVIGGYIGNLAGFSGAAATSYGLAFLGGGSLAAGGLGMAGGSAVLGLGFGIVNGVKGG